MQGSLPMPVLAPGSRRRQDNLRSAMWSFVFMHGRAQIYTILFEAEDLGLPHHFNCTAFEGCADPSFSETLTV